MALHLGWSDSDLATLPWARFWNPQLAPLPERARRALERGLLAPPMLTPLAEAGPGLMGDGEGLEDGYALTPDGGMRVAILTDMPGVTPAMIDWWFGWHGDQAAKYKLWHPQAHVHVAWQDEPPAGSEGRARYVGQTSIVDEYIGSRLLKGAIRFVDPASLGFADARLADPEQATIVCARTGLVGGPLDIGWLAHSVVRTGSGSVMRSRFWFGGGHIASRGGPGGLVAKAMARKFLRFSESEARALLTHCAEEMQHLASFLPALHAAVTQETRPATA